MKLQHWHQRVHRSPDRTHNLLQPNHKQLQSQVGRLATELLVLPGCESVHLSTQHRSRPPKFCCNLIQYRGSKILPFLVVWVLKPPMMMFTCLIFSKKSVLKQKKIIARLSDQNFQFDIRPKTHGEERKEICSHLGQTIEKIIIFEISLSIHNFVFQFF